MSWVPVPNNHDSDGYTFIITKPNGLQIYGAWQMILQVASKCMRRGDLISESGKPYTPASIARKSRCDQKQLEESLPTIFEVGWLEEVVMQDKEFEEYCAECRADCAETGAKRAGLRLEGKGTEGKERKELNGSEMNGREARRVAPLALMAYGWQGRDKVSLENAINQKKWTREQVLKALAKSREVIRSTGLKNPVGLVIKAVENDKFSADDLRISEAHLEEYGKSIKYNGTA